MTENIFEKALDASTFSVLAAIEGTAYPTDDITVYTDAASAYQVHVLNQRIAETADGDEANALDEQRTELVEKVKASRLTFTLRGFAPRIITAINDSAAASHPDADLDQGPVAREINFRYLAESIVNVTDAHDAVDSHHWTLEEIVALEEKIPSEEFARLMSKMEEVVFASLAFESTVNADF